MACKRTVNLEKKVKDNGFNLSTPFYNFDYVSGMDWAHVEGVGGGRRRPRRGAAEVCDEEEPYGAP